MLPKVYIPHEQLRGQRLLIKTCILDKCSTTLPIIYVGVSFRLGSWWMFKQRVIIDARIVRTFGMYAASAVASGIQWTYLKHVLRSHWSTRALAARRLSPGASARGRFASAGALAIVINLSAVQPRVRTRSIVLSFQTSFARQHYFVSQPPLCLFVCW